MINKLKLVVRKIKNKMLHIIPSNDIYMFHHVSINPRVENSSCKLDTGDFINFIKSRGNIIDLESLMNSAYKEKKCAITFDDGLEDVYLIAYPILKKYNIPFTIFVLSDFIGLNGYLNENQLVELSNDNLVTIGIHGSKHEIIPNLNREDKKKEIIDSKAKIEKIINMKCEFFSFSHGRYDKESLDIVTDAGYKYAFTVKGQPFNWITNRGDYSIPRLSIEKSTKSIYH